MKLIFNLDYHTTFGEDLVLNILPADDTAKASLHKMTTLDGEHWFVEINKAVKAETYIDYYYSVLRGEEEKRHEWLVEPHRLEFAATKASCYTVYDHWIDIPDDAYMYSSAFTECVLARQRALSTKSEYPCTIRLKVRAPQLRADERLAIVGEAVSLGAWDARKAVAMTEHGCHEWVASLDASQLPQGRVEFKFIILGKDVDNVVIEFDGSSAQFSFGGTTMICRLVVGKYPKYRDVIPQNNANVLKIDRTLLLNTVRRVAVCSNKASNHIKFTLKEGQLEVSAQDLGFALAAYEKIACDYAGDELTIGFKSTFLTEILSNMGCNGVVIKFADARRAALILPAEEEAESEKICGILMPIMIS